MIADTTVMEKGIAFPTDSKLLNRARAQLVEMVPKAGVALRQTYARTRKFAALNAGKTYEFGCKVALVIAHKQGLALSSMALSRTSLMGILWQAVFKKPKTSPKLRLIKPMWIKATKGMELRGRRSIFLAKSGA